MVKDVPEVAYPRLNARKDLGRSREIVCKEARLGHSKDVDEDCGCYLAVATCLGQMTWRLCFHISLPFGLIRAIVLLLYSNDGSKAEFDLPLGKEIKRLDLVSFIVLLRR